MKLVKLKPCPFCGGEARRIKNFVYYVACSNPKCLVVPYTFGYNRQSDATKAWNKRTKDADSN